MKKRIRNLHIYDDQLVHYGRDKTRTASRISRTFPSVPSLYYDLSDVVIELPQGSELRGNNVDQFLDDFRRGKLHPHEGKYVAYLNGAYRGNLDDPGVLYFMVRSISGRKYLDVFRVPVLEEGPAGLKVSLKKALVSERPKKRNDKEIKFYREPNYRTHAYL